MLNSWVMHHHTSPAPSIMVCGGIGNHSHTPLICIAGTLNSQRYISEVLECPKERSSPEEGSELQTDPSGNSHSHVQFLLKEKNESLRFINIRK
ncbi:hypothetical protein TNCV_3728171 [Trichonephila clavipes]|uniref:Uncharacterized protein n=1 Tax=Trichonephila clavipes TaxID=2585209 RepID=A0A8X6UT08_TRICX|nr:hypothetical protein TNCV_3728171 [Trichonephila clavipes]